MNKEEFNRLLALAHLNDDTADVLGHVYDNDIPHPYFDPAKIGFRSYRVYSKTHNVKYNSRDVSSNKSVVFYDNEFYLPGEQLITIKGASPLTEKDYLITSCITDNDHLYTVPYVFNSWHLSMTHRANKDIIVLQNSNRPFIADILLGTKKTHRDLFFKLLQERGLLDQCIINYFKHYKSVFLKQSKEAVNQRIDALEGNAHVDTTIMTENNVTLSQLVSRDIYENSWFTVVAETICDNKVFFPTEKIGKPMMANRPFIVLSGKHYLRRLREIGFKTFHPFISEDYDNIDNMEDRMRAAFDSFIGCMSQDQNQLRTKIKDILDHNETVMKDKALLAQRARKFLDNIRSTL
jgi:hypothetical protein